MLDMIRPYTANNITLKDLKHCKMTPVFFDTFFNLEKYLDSGAAVRLSKEEMDE